MNSPSPAATPESNKSPRKAASAPLPAGLPGRMDEEPDKAEARWRLALDAAGEGVWDWDIETGAAFYSHRWKTMLGYEEHEVEPSIEAWRKLIHPEDRATVIGAVEAHGRGETESIVVEHRLRGKDGSWHWVMARGRVIDWVAPGRPRRVIGTHTDVHEAKLGQTTRPSLARRHELALKAGRFGTFEHDFLASTASWDTRAWEILGLAPREGAPTPAEVESILLPADREAWQSVFDPRQAAQESRSVRVRIAGPSGEIRTILALAFYEGRSGRLVARLTGVLEDVTERVAAESRQAQAQRLETAGTLAGGIAHDFNNLLTGLLGFVELSLDAVQQGQPANGLLEEARSCGLRARELVKRLLLFARRSPDTFPRAVQLRELVTESQPLIRASLPVSIQLTTHLPPDLPPVEADPGQIQEVLMNLCANAGHAIGSNPGRLDVALRREPLGDDSGLSCPPGDYVCLSVSDTGCGMTEATQARVYDPFYTTKPSGEGTGLGLAMVHGIVASHGGAIRLKSEVNVGTTFEVFLPLRIESEPAPASPAPSRPLPSGDLRTILLADDEPAVRMVVTTVLERAGFRVESCAEGSEALARFRRQPDAYALALLDLSMPGMNGRDLFTELQAVRTDLPVVLMSGDHVRHGAPTLPASPHVTCLPKPFSAEELLAALGRVLPVTS